MTSEALKDRLDAKPFHAFALRLPDGRALPIAHPEFISVEPDGRTAIVWKGGGRGGHWTVDLELISDLAPLNDQRKS